MALLNNSLKFDPARGVLQGFLFGVARNLLMKQHDAARRYPRISHTASTDEPIDDIADSAAGPLERLLASEAAEGVRNALQQLAPHYRDVVILYEMHDLSYMEIAQICNIDIGTVRSRLSRARARLVELLQADLARTLTTGMCEISPPQQEATL